MTRRNLRFALLVFATVVVQVAFFPHWRAFGVVPDLGLVLAIAVAYREGPEPAALAGFAAGLLFDLFLETPLGCSALAYALTGYVVGVLQTGLLRSPRWVAPFLGAVGGFAGGLAFAVIGILAGVDALSVGRTIVVVGIAAIYDALLAPFVFALVGRVFREERDTTLAWRVR